MSLGRCCCSLSSALVPPEWLVHGTPLCLELVGVSAGGAAAEVEGVDALIRDTFHQLPVHEHVRRHAIVRTQRGRPCYLEFTIVAGAPREARAARDRLVIVIRNGEQCLIAEFTRHCIEEAARHDGSAEVAHVVRENPVEWLDLLRAYAHGDALLLRSADLAAQLGAQPFPQRVGATPAVQQYGDLAMRYFKVRNGADIITAAQLENVRAVIRRHCSGVRRERCHSARRAERTAVVQERDRYEKMSEQGALNAYERKHPFNFVGGAVQRDEIGRVVTHGIQHHAAPAVQMEVCPARLGPNEVVPALGRPGVALHAQRQRRATACGGTSGSGAVARNHLPSPASRWAMDVNLNSPSRRSSLGSTFLMLR